MTNTNDWDTTWGTIDWKNATQEEILKKTNDLINTGANPNAADENGLTPLMYAVSRDGVSVVEALIDGGADVNAQDKVGNTALMRMALLSRFGICRAYPAIAKVLIENGADINIKNYYGRRAINMAKKSEVRNLVRNARPDPVKVILHKVKTVRQYQ